MGLLDIHETSMTYERDLSARTDCGMCCTFAVGMQNEL